ncbi:MAG TPA: hypothetical protein VFB60_03290 [Ktedonobacteraceae bacterium]|nr:hypothetical protein [Ktedonobacteraceae bacterium]
MHAGGSSRSAGRETARCPVTREERGLEMRKQTSHTALFLDEKIIEGSKRSGTVVQPHKPISVPGLCGGDACEHMTAVAHPSLKFLVIEGVYQFHGPMIPCHSDRRQSILFISHRASQKWSFHPERLASEPLGRGRCWRWAVPTASTFLSL